MARSRRFRFPAVCKLSQPTVGGPQAIIEPELDELDVLAQVKLPVDRSRAALGRKEAAKNTRRAAETDRFCAKPQVFVFDFGCPVSEEAVLEAGADHPAP